MSWHHHHLLCGRPETLPANNIGDRCATVDKVLRSLAMPTSLIKIYLSIYLSIYMILGFNFRYQHVLENSGPPDRILVKPWRRLFLAAYTLWAKPGCCCCPAWQSVSSLLPCVADCCTLYTVCKVERFVLTIIKRRLWLYTAFQFIRAVGTISSSVTLQSVVDTTSITTCELVVGTRRRRPRCCVYMWTSQSSRLAISYFVINKTLHYHYTMTGKETNCFCNISYKTRVIRAVIKVQN